MVDNNKHRAMCTSCSYVNTSNATTLTKRSWNCSSILAGTNWTPTQPKLKTHGCAPQTLYSGISNNTTNSENNNTKCKLTNNKENSLILKVTNILQGDPHLFLSFIFVWSIIWLIYQILLLHKVTVISGIHISDRWRCKCVYHGYPVTSTGYRGIIIIALSFESRLKANSKTIYASLSSNNQNNNISDMLVL